MQTFSDIGTIWRDWDEKNLTNIPQKVYYVLYIWFDDNLEWSKKLEIKYMILKNVKLKK